MRSLCPLRLVGCLGLLLAALGAAACGGGTPGSDGSVVKVGVLLPLTGATAWGGQPARIAAELSTPLERRRASAAVRLRGAFAGAFPGALAGRFVAIRTSSHRL